MALVIAGFAAYSRRVQYFRSFALICFAFGLFVQVAAQASAMPQVQAESTADCSEMAQSGDGDMKMQPGGQGEPCEITLECLSAMNCIPPIALATSVPAHAPFPSTRTPYQPDGVARLNGLPMRPESPPPQPPLTA